MIRWFITAIIFVSAGALASESSRPEIIFDNTIEISDSASYTLGDFVTLKGHSGKFMETVEKYPVDAEKISTGLNAQAIREIYKELVLNHPSIAEENPKLVVPQKIELTKVTGFSEAVFKRKLTNHLTSQCAGCEVSVERITGNNLPASSQWNVDWSEVKLSPSILIPVQFNSGKVNGIKSPHWISAVTKVKRNVLVAKRNFAFNEKFIESDFEAKFMDVTFAKEDPLTLDTLKTYQKTARPLMKGKAVFPSDLKREPATERGKAVKVIAGDDLYEVSLAAIAEDTGHIGDLIKVKNLESKKVFTAVVIDKGVVKIQ